MTCHGPGVKSSDRFTIHTISVAATSVQKPWISKPLTIHFVISSISIDTKNQAIPSVRNASGNVINRSRGFSTVFRTPNTAAASSNAPAPEVVTPVSSTVTTRSTSAFVSHEIPRRTIRGASRRSGLAWYRVELIASAYRAADPGK